MTYGTTVQAWNLAMSWESMQDMERKTLKTSIQNAREKGISCYYESSSDEEEDDDELYTGGSKYS